MLTFGAQAGLPWATCATRPLRSLGTCHLSHCKIIGWAVYANKSKNRTRGHSKERKKRFFFKILPSSAHMRNKKHRRCWRGLYRGCSVSLQPLLTWNVAPVSREPLKNAEVAPLKRAKLERYTLVEDCIHSTVKMCNLALSSSFLHCCNWFDIMCVENGLTVCPGEMFFR